MFFILVFCVFFAERELVRERVRESRRGRVRELLGLGLGLKFNQKKINVQ